MQRVSGSPARIASRTARKPGYRTAPDAVRSRRSAWWTLTIRFSKADSIGWVSSHRYPARITRSGSWERNNSTVLVSWRGARHDCSVVPQPRAPRKKGEWVAHDGHATPYHLVFTFERILGGDTANDLASRAPPLNAAAGAVPGARPEHRTAMRRGGVFNICVAEVRPLAPRAAGGRRPYREQPTAALRRRDRSRRRGGRADAPAGRRERHRPPTAARR